MRNVTEADRFYCKERRCEVHNDRIYVGFKHRLSILNDLGGDVISAFNLKDW